MVTIEADEEVWRFLQVRKSPGDSNNDVLRRELGFDGDSDSKTEIELVADTAPDVPDDIAAAIAAWEPPEDLEVHTEHAREAVRAAAAWLSQQSAPKRKAEIVAGAYADGTLSERIWWERAARPGLQALDAVAVEGRKYRWVGDSENGRF